MIFDNDYPGGWFGNNWGASVCHETRHLPTPVGEECIYCEVFIVDGDQGLTFPYYGATEYGMRSTHINCFLKDIGIPAGVTFTYKCEHCGKASQNPNDAKHRYCGACHHFCDDDQLRPPV